MQQYVFSMSSRMLAIAFACLTALCVLLFMLGVEIGRMAATSDTAAAAAAAVPAPTLPNLNDLRAVLPGASPAAAPASVQPPAAAPAASYPR